MDPASDWLTPDTRQHLQRFLGLLSACSPGCLAFCCFDKLVSCLSPHVTVAAPCELFSVSVLLLGSSFTHYTDVENVNEPHC